MTAAAVRRLKAKAELRRRRVVDFLKSHGGTFDGTESAMMEGTGLAQRTCRRYLAALQRDGVIIIDRSNVQVGSSWINQRSIKLAE